MKKIWILTAMSEEARLIIDAFWLQKSASQGNISFYENAEMVLVLSGVGKIQATLATTLMIERFSPQRLINIGIAGSLLGQKAEIGQVFLVNKLCQHDMYLPFDGEHLSYAKGEIQLPKLAFLTQELASEEEILCLTGDQFIDDQQKVEELAYKTAGHLVEMEAFAFASVAREFGKLDQTIVIKAISDGANSQAQTAHMDNLDFAMQNSLLGLKNILSKLS